MIRAVVSFLVALFVLCVMEAQCLKPGGQNVLTKNETYYDTVLKTTKKLTYRQKCVWTCKWIVWCSTKCSDVTAYRWVNTTIKVQKTRPVYQCQQGWKANGDECTTAICVGGCKNNGTCIAPDTCKCSDGWNGTICHLGEPCEKIHAPDNGDMNCTGNTTDHVCYFKCKPGYELIGSASRNCSAKNVWTSVETTCKIIHCPYPVASANGFVYTPCDTEFESHCIVGCAYGYFIEGTNKITCDARGAWEPRNISCKEIKACEPNPCKHGGKCSSHSSSRYSCDCSHTGYKGNDCEIGHVATPTYPTLTRDVPSAPLEFQSSPPSDYVTLVPICRGVEFSPRYLRFKTNSTRQFMTFTAKQPGLYFVKYILYGANTIEFQCPTTDIIFVEEPRNSTNKTAERHLSLPVGCHQLEISKCPLSSAVILSSSTSPWLQRGPVTSTTGVVTLQVGETVLPLSLFGTSIMNKNPHLVDKECDVTEANYSSEKLIKYRVLTRSFLEAIQSSLPPWLMIGLPRRRESNTFIKPNTKTDFISGSILRQMTIGSGQPLMDESSFSLLLSRNINLTVEKDTDILGSYQDKSPFAIAVDLCSPSPKKVVIRPSAADLDGVKKISVFKRLLMDGWDLTVYSLQISRNESIEKLKKGLYWNGKGFVQIDSSMKGNLALVSALRKSFTSQDLMNCRVEFDGTMVIGVDDLDNVLHSPLDQKWSVDLYGNTKLTMEFKVEGKKTNVSLNAPQSLSYATFGGNVQGNDERLFGDEGLYISHALEGSPFLRSDLSDFVELGTNKTLSAVMHTKLNKQSNQRNNRSEDADIISGISMAFRGHLKFGPLRFEDVDIRLWTQQSKTTPLFHGEGHSGIQLRGDYRDDARRKLGIFRSTPLHPRVYIPREQNRSSSGYFQSVVKFLGLVKQVNVSFTRNGLSFNTSGKVHGLYDARIRGDSPLESWEHQRFTATGEFEDKSGGLMEALYEAINGYGVRVLNRTMSRVAAFTAREERADSRLRNVLNFTETKRREMNKAEEEYMATERMLRAAEFDFKNLEGHVSGRLARLRVQLDKLCEVKQCRNVCREGVVCRHCDYEVAGKSKETCLGDCHKTEQRMVLSGNLVQCNNTHVCTRVYLKSGLSSGDLEDAFVKIRREVFSYGIKSSDFQQYSVRTDVKTLFSHGSSNGDACTSRKISLSNPFGDFFDTSGSRGKMSCRKDRRNGYWDCRVRSDKCHVTRFEYVNYRKRYACERPCEVHVTNETVPKSCCSTVPCAFRVLNTTCVAMNSLCRMIRGDALKGDLSPNSSVEVLEKLESTRANVSYLQIMKRRARLRLLSTSNSLNVSQKAVANLMKAYNVTVESRENIFQILAGPLRLKELLDEPLKSVIKFDSVTFNMKITDADGPTSLPVQFMFNLNGSKQDLATVLDFKNLNTSLKSIAKDILRVYMGGLVSHNMRNKRSTEDGSNSFPDTSSKTTAQHTISSLQKYHKLCSEFTNFERGLYDIITSLYNLTSETQQLINEVVRTNASEHFNASSALESSRINDTIAAEFGLNISKGAYLSGLETDPLVTGALELNDEASQDGFEPLHLTSELLFRNWYAAMENIFSVVIKDCSGFDDCVAYIMDRLSEMHEDVPGTDKIRQLITKVRTKLFDLIQSLDLSVADAVEVSLGILGDLEGMTGVKIFCARSPNITEHPESFTATSEARTLHLTCNATGDALVYKWRLNGDLLAGQTSNVLLIKNTSVSQSGNYTCEVSNHISIETSTPALVVIHPPPSITVQPADSLGINLFNNDSLRCVAESVGDNVVYEWWFKSINSTSFVPLPSATFSYLNFSPMRAQHEGWYFCNVSTPYGFSISKTSFVKALRFTLPQPVAVFSLSVISRLNRNTSTVYRTSRSINKGSARVYSQMSHLLSVASGYASNGTNPQITHLNQVTACKSLKSSKNGSAPEICRWKFEYVGVNTTTGNASEIDMLKASAQKVIDSARSIQTAVMRLRNATDNGVLSFVHGDQRYALEPHTFTVERFSTVCDPGRQLVREDFRCVECRHGYYGELNAVGAATCLPCSVGSYEANTGRTSCMKCPEGFTTANQGSYDESQCKVICPAGQYGNITENVGQCLNCPRNTYQPKEGQFNCLACPSGMVTSNEGSKDMSKCIPEPTARHTTAKVTSEHTTAKVTSEHTTAKVTSKHTTAKVTSEHTTAKVTSEHTTAKVTSEHTTAKVTTSEHTTAKVTTSEHTTANVTSEHTTANVTREHTTAKVTSEHTTAKVTSEPKVSRKSTARKPSAGQVASSGDGKNSAPVIGGVAGGFVVLLGLLVLFLFLRRKRQITKDNDSSDGKDIVVSQPAFELTDWCENAAYLDDGDFLNGSAEAVNPTHESSGGSISPLSNGAAVVTNSTYAPFFDTEHLDNNTNSGAFQINDVSDSVFGNFGNPLYDALETVNQKKQLRLDLSGDPIIDEDA